MKNFNFKKELTPLLVIFIAILFSLYFYSVLPETVAIHWDFNGEPDGYGSKFTASFLIPAIMIGMYVMFLFLPLIDPKRKRYEQFLKIYNYFKIVFFVFFLFLYLVFRFINIGYNISIKIIMPIALGILFMFIGNYLSKIKTNWFIGIRTPWTLSNEEVWNKTQRFGGKMFFLGGLFFVLSSLIDHTFGEATFFAVIAIIVLSPIVYSYFLYKKIK